MIQTEQSTLTLSFGIFIMTLIKPVTFELEIQEHWGVLTTGIRKAWGGFRSGISTGER